MKENLEAISRYFRWEKADDTFLSIVKGISILVVGILFKGIYDAYYIETIDFTFMQFAVTLLFVILYAYLEFRSIRKLKSFPVEITKHLLNQEHLTDANKQLSRQRLIHNYINRSIRALNENTCPTTAASADRLCETGLSSGIGTVLLDLIKNTNQFLGIESSDITMGVYLDFHLKMNHGYDFTQEYPDSYSDFFTQRDDLDVNWMLPNTLGNVLDDRGAMLELHQAFIKAFSNSTFEVSTVQVDKKDVTVVVSPTPKICEIPNESGGFIFIMYNGIEKPESDCKELLQIFGRIMINWVTKYNSCVINHFEKMKIEQQPSEQINEPAVTYNSTQTGEPISSEFPKDLQERLDKWESSQSK